MAVFGQPRASAAFPLDKEPVVPTGHKTEKSLPPWSIYSQLKIIQIAVYASSDGGRVDLWIMLLRTEVANNNLNTQTLVASKCMMYLNN
jgi:hypothetical protein